MDPAIYSVAISYFIIGTLVGIASTVFLFQPSMEYLHQLTLENKMLKEEIEELRDEAYNMRIVKDVVDKLYEEEEEEEEVVANLPPPPPAIRSCQRCLSNENHDMNVSPVFTP